MNPFDAKLTLVSTVETGAATNVSDPTPNATGIGAGVAATFDVVIEGVAGNNIGASIAPYTLTVIAYSITNGANAPTLNPALPAQTFGPSIWTLIAGSNDYQMRQQITVPVGANHNQLVQYSAALIHTPQGIFSFIESEPFLLV